VDRLEHGREFSPGVQVRGRRQPQRPCQRGLTAGRSDIATVARGFGIAKTLTVTEQDAAGELAELLFKAPGPTLAAAKIAITDDPWALPEKDGTAIAHRFRTVLGL